MSKLLFARLMLAIAVVLTASVLGCTREITYREQHGDTIQEATYRNTGFNTQLGKLRYQRPDGTVIEVENVNSEARALNIAEEAVKRLPAITP